MQTWEKARLEDGPVKVSEEELIMEPNYLQDVGSFFGMAMLVSGFIGAYLLFSSWFAMGSLLDFALLLAAPVSLVCGTTLLSVSAPRSSRRNLSCLAAESVTQNANIPAAASCNIPTPRAHERPVYRHL
jgi:hypothetical protein